MDYFGHVVSLLCLGISSDTHVNVHPMGTSIPNDSDKLRIAPSGDFDMDVVLFLHDSDIING